MNGDFFFFFFLHLREAYTKTFTCIKHKYFLVLLSYIGEHESNFYMLDFNHNDTSYDL